MSIKYRSIKHVSSTEDHPTSPPRIAIAHDYLTQRGGAEKVVLALSRAFPGSPIYTTLYDPDGTYPEFAALDIRVSPLNAVSGFRKWHRSALPVLPLASSMINIDADVVIASSSGWAHGFRTRGKVLVYCYTPARWLYQKEAYLGGRKAFAHRVCLSVLIKPLTLWDRQAALNASRYLAISSVVRQRISDAYGLPSTVVPAPYTIDSSLDSEPIPVMIGAPPFFLCVSRLLPYKNVDKVVDAFENTERSLLVIGTGPEEHRLKEHAGPNVVFQKCLTDAQMRWAYANCVALVAASFEDYGLTPLEASIYGKPSAVLRWGGFLDTVVEGLNGVFFDNPTAADIRAAVCRIEASSWHKAEMVAHVDQFSEERFADRMVELVDEVHSNHD